MSRLMRGRVVGEWMSGGEGICPRNFSQAPLPEAEAAVAVHLNGSWLGNNVPAMDVADGLNEWSSLHRAPAARGLTCRVCECVGGWRMMRMGGDFISMSRLMCASISLTIAPFNLAVQRDTTGQQTLDEM